MAKQYGLTSIGFVPKTQQVIISELNASHQAVFGANINLGPEAIFGQQIQIYSEREALIWELGLALYASQYPGGAEGTSVDNILALNNLKRLLPTPTKTNTNVLIQANQKPLYGLVLFGTPGTVIPSGSFIANTASPALQFSLLSAVTIAAAVNAVQQVFFSNVPDAGNFTLSIEDADGNVLTTPAIEFDALAGQTFVSFSVVPVTGSFQLVLTQAGVPLTTAAILYTDNAAAVQSKIQALTGYSGVTVSGSFAAGFTITWGSICNPLVTQTANTLAVTIDIVDSAQSAINNLQDPDSLKYPYTDVQVTGFTTGLNFFFGQNAVIGSNPSSGAQAQSLMTIASSTLVQGVTVTNLNVVNNTVGAPAQGVGSAQCTQNGPNFVGAGTLTVIGSPTTGWTGVTNQLDCISGTNLETDSDALIRRAALLAAQANGPIQSIVEKVLEVSGVAAALPFQNLTNAAQQTISFASVPVSGNWKLIIGGQTTANIAYNASSADVQTAINALTGYFRALVTGNVQYGFVIDFNGSSGGQAQSLAQVTANTTGVTITTDFGRPPHSFEIVVSGGLDQDIAQAIYNSQPAGISSYSNPLLSTTGSVISGNLTLTLSTSTGLSIGNAIFGPGVSNGATISNIVGPVVTMSKPALNNASGTYTFSNAKTITDAFGNPTEVFFSRPTEIPFYVSITMITDQYNIPGVPSSGVNSNSKFNLQGVMNIQQDVVTIGNEVDIGGLVIGFGSNGLIGAFNNVPGIVSYTMYFGAAPNPVSNANVQLQAEQQAVFQTFNVVVSYT